MKMLLIFGLLLHGAFAFAQGDLNKGGGDIHKGGGDLNGDGIYADDAHSSPRTQLLQHRSEDELETSSIESGGSSVVEITDEPQGKNLAPDKLTHPKGPLFKRIKRRMGVSDSADPKAWDKIFEKTNGNLNPRDFNCP